MKGILGKKIGMTQVFTVDGKLIPVTVVLVEPNVVIQIKTVDKDGYDAIQLATNSTKEKHLNKPQMGHLKKANTEPQRFLREIRGVNVEEYTLGQVIRAEELFNAGDMVDVTGISKGKGFQGVIKRWNQSRGPMGHGSQYHRGVGSLGTMRPMHVIKGKHMPGHMGNVQRTVQNLEIVSVDVENNVILIKGNVPGPKNSYVVIRETVKANKTSKEDIQLISYEVVAEDTQETPVENTDVVVENETVEEEQAEEVKEEKTEKPEEEQPVEETTE